MLKRTITFNLEYYEIQYFVWQEQIFGGSGGSEEDTLFHLLTSPSL